MHFVMEAFWRCSLPRKSLLTLYGGSRLAGKEDCLQFEGWGAPQTYVRSGRSFAKWIWRWLLHIRHVQDSPTNLHEGEWAHKTNFQGTEIGEIMKLITGC